MADDELTRKDAEMGRLLTSAASREFLVAFREGQKKRQAEEQPMEQNAAPQTPSNGRGERDDEVRASRSAVAAPDVAAMVKRLEQFAFHLRTIENQYAETMREKIDRDAAELMDQAAALIEKLGQGWIPVSKILPPVGEIVAVLLSDRRPWAGWHKGGNDWSINDSTVDVTHWMPLPPPPERP